jgi:hypothetical protein
MKFKRTLRIGKDISVFDFVKTRIVTPRELLKGIKDPICANKPPLNIPFSARYYAGKALEGYDFI